MSLHHRHSSFPSGTHSPAQKLLCVSGVRLPVRGSSVESPCPVFGRSSHARPPHRLPVWRSSAIEEGGATCTGGAARSYFSPQGTVAVPGKCIMGDLPRQGGMLTATGHGEMEKTLSLPAVWGGCGKPICICNCNTRTIPSLPRNTSFLYKLITLCDQIHVFLIKITVQPDLICI